MIPYACEEDCDPAPCCFDGTDLSVVAPVWSGRTMGGNGIRDFTASVGVTAFENEA